MSKKSVSQKPGLRKEELPYIPPHKLRSPFDVAAGFPDAENYLALFSSLDHPTARLCATKMQEAIGRRNRQASCGRRAITDESTGHDPA